MTTKLNNKAGNTPQGNLNNDSSGDNPLNKGVLGIQSPKSNDSANQRPGTSPQNNSGKNLAQSTGDKKEEEKKKPKDKDIFDEENSGYQRPRLVRAPIFPDSDRAELEKDYMERLTAGGGLLGFRPVDLNDLKRQVCEIEDDCKLPIHRDMLQNLRVDGIYVDDPEVYQKFTDINIQKLEERLLKNGQSNFFKHNGELKLDNDLLQDELTRPCDLAFEQPMTYQTKEVNAVLSDRMNQYKKRYFRLDIVLGKMRFERLYNFMNEEDRVAVDLTKLFHDYEMRTSLAMLPFYQERIAHIEEQIEKVKSGEEYSETPKDDADFLEKTLKEVNEEFQKEKRELQAMSDKIYSTWDRIDTMRKDKDYRSTTVKLKVQKIKYSEDDDEYTDFQFNFQTQTPSTERNDQKPIESSEMSRRRKIKNLKIQCHLLINGREVSVTQKQPINWPDFEVNFSEMFQVHVFTMPGTIQLKVFLVDGLFETEIDLIDVEVPGKHVKTLTCACQLIQEIQFSRNSYQDRQQRRKQNYKLDQIDDKENNKSIANTAAPVEEEKKETDKKVPTKEDLDYKGSVFVKAEWKGNGPRLPPIKSENLFKLHKVMKNRREYDVDDAKKMLLKEMYIDVNDPRNQVVLKLIKQTKNEFLIKLLIDDSKNLLHEMSSFRHKLLKARCQDPSLFIQTNFDDQKIPGLESEIVSSALQGQRRKFLGILEELFRREAYQKYLMTRAKDDEKEIKDLQTKDDHADRETIRRRQIIKERIKARQDYGKSNYAKNTSTYKSVVKEMEFEYDGNVLLSVFNKYFQNGRKLKPKIVEQPVQSYDKIQKCTIAVHVIRGENVPVREDYLNDQSKQMQMQNNIYNAPMIGTNNLLASTNVRGQQSMMGGTFNQTNRFNQFGGFNATMQGQKVIEEQGKNIGARGINTDTVHDVETYVEVKVQYYSNYAIVQSTDTDVGSMPQWNEVLEFPLESINKEKFTQEELASADTQIIASIFDKQTTKRNLDGEIISVDEHRYLGSVTIPLQTLLQNPGRTEFNYQVKRPICLTGYTVKHDEFMVRDEKVKSDQGNRDKDPPTYLNLSISLEPNIELPFENSEFYYPGVEDRELLDKGSEWVDKLRKRNKKFKNVNINLFGTNIDGHSVLIQRFLKPMQPPCLLENQQPEENQLEAAARFVSLIPFIEDIRIFEDLPDVFCTVQEFLDLGGGDYEEHAILLCNYFNFIDQYMQQRGPGADNSLQCESFLVFGNGMPEGFTVYVMRKHKDVKKNDIAEKGNIELWCPMTGQCYFFKCTKSQGFFMQGGDEYMEPDLKEPNCPLKEIHCIVSQDNVWANIQKHESPCLMSFDLNNKKHWKPFHKTKKAQDGSREVIEKFESIQTDNIIYQEIMPKEKVLKVENAILKFLIERFQEERVNRVRKTTKWDIQNKDDIRDILEKCETYMRTRRQGGHGSTLKFNPYKGNPLSVSHERNDSLNHIFAELKEKTSGVNGNKKVFGYPINMTYVSHEQLWHAVQTTKLHLISRHDIEFSMTVFIKPYPCNIMSVFIYLAGIVEKTQ